jgi:AcrR family transcriptional regulator
MGRPREHDERMRAALLDAAERMVEAGGAEALSVRALADEVGTTTRAVYSVFGSKDGLLEALAGRLFELLAAAVDEIALTEDPRADLIAAALHGFRRTALDHPFLYQLVFLQVVPDLQVGPTFDDVAHSAFARLEHLVARVVAGNDDDARQLAQVVHALTEGLATMEARGALGSADDAAETWQRALTTLLAGVPQPARGATRARRRP